MGQGDYEDVVYYGQAWDATESLSIKQGFESVSHDGVQRVVNREWAERCKSVIPGSRSRADRPASSESKRNQANQNPFKESEGCYIGGDKAWQVQR
jgi:hypothetical protein